MPNKNWKDWERYVAGLFGTSRNPLSGSNNRDDSGGARLGDILYSKAVVEVKSRKSNATLRRAAETMSLARGSGLPFVHVEGRKGNRGLMALCVDKPTAEFLIKKLRERWEYEQVC